MQLNEKSRKRLGWILSACFLGVMLMGPGPGLLLVNPDPNDPLSPAIFLGWPIIYLWGLFWYAVQLTIILIAYRFVWKYDEGEEEP